jgi:hypothetical protein
LSDYLPPPCCSSLGVGGYVLRRVLTTTIFFLVLIFFGFGFFLFSISACFVSSFLLHFFFSLSSGTCVPD